MHWALTANLDACAHFFEQGTRPLSTYHNPRARQTGARTLHVFTDGSAIAAGPQQRLGSAFTVWHGRADFEFMQGCYSHSLGCIHDHGNDGPFIAECHALRLALCWIFTQPNHVPAVVHFDSFRAGRAAAGEWNLSGASGYARKVCRSLRALALLVAETHEVDFQHVKAHAGCVPNIVADAFAKATAYGRCGMQLPMAVLSLLEASDVEWAWLSLRSDPGFPAVDAVLGRKVLSPSPPSLNELAAGVQDVGTASVRPLTSSLVQMRCVSYNVQSALDGKSKHKDGQQLCGARLQLMFESFDQRHMDFIGLQETRLKGDARRTTARYSCVQSSAVQGQLGVALWIARRWRGAGGQPVAATHLTVLHSDPRLLLVRCCSQAIKADFCVAHAPQKQKGQGAAVCSEWWKTAVSLLTSLARDSHPLILFIDANASIGAAATSAFGTHAAEPDDMNSQSFEELLLRRQLWLPATFEQCHEGPSHTFVSKPEGNPHRIDYVAVVQAWTPACVASSHVLYDLDVAQRADDHFPVVLDLRISVRGCRRLDGTARAWEHGNSSKLRDLVKGCEVPVWDTSVDAHAQLVTQQLQLLQRKVFPKASLRPKKTFVSKESWQLIQQRNASRAWLRRLDAKEHVARVRVVFTAWRWTCSVGCAQEVAQACSGAVFSARAAKVQAVVKYKGLCAQLRQALLGDKAAHIAKVAARCVDGFSEQNTRKAYQALQVFRQNAKNVKRQAHALPKLELADGTLANTAQERADRWLQHFSEVESAEPIPRELLPMLAHEQSRPVLGQVLNSHGGFIPTLLDWERAMRAGKPRKHPGPDGIRQELCHLHVPSIASLSYALFLKVALCVQEPLRFKGGLLTALYKGKGEHSKCSNSRSILLSNTLGKKWHSCLRGAALPYVQDQLRPEQAGAVPRRTLEAAAMAIRAPVMLAQTLKKPAAVIFLDVKSAFYTVFRPLLLGQHDDDEAFMYALRALRIPPIYAEWVRDFAEDKPIAAKANLPACLVQQLMQTLQHSWFATEGSLEVGYSMAGKRPGDPLGDLLFVLLCADVLHSIHDTLISEGLTTPGC